MPVKLRAENDAYASQPTQIITFYSHPFFTFFIALNERASNLKSIHEKKLVKNG